MSEKVKVGAVVYDPKVTVIWGIIADFFEEEGCPVQPVFYKDYEQQVDGLMAAEIDIAWNSPLAWLDAYLRTDGQAIMGPMRDTDNDRHTCCLVRAGRGLDMLEDLRGKTIGFGAIDSPQARLIPINLLRRAGLEYGRDYVERRYEVGVGLHGDHVGGELDAARALAAGEVDASFALDLNYEAWSADGTLDASQVVCIARTPDFDHCIFCGRPDMDRALFAHWSEVLCRMDYGNPQHKEMMDLEGLKAWVPGRYTGFGQLQEANAYLNFLPTFNGRGK